MSEQQHRDYAASLKTAKQALLNTDLSNFFLSRDEALISSKKMLKHLRQLQRSMYVHAKKYYSHIDDMESWYDF